MQNLIPILLLAIATATSLDVLLKRFNMPTVIGYIFTGAVIGNLLDIQVHGNEPLENIAELGVVFLMFTIGLEFSVSHLNSMKREVFLFGLLQVLVTATVIAAVAQTFFGLAIKTAIIVGAGLALSSTAIVLKLLTESGKIKSDFGRSSVGILIFQDIAVIPILLMITIFTSHDKSLSELLLETAISLAQIGEFSLVVFSLLLGNKLLDSTSVQVVMVATVLSMILTPLLINRLDRIVGLIIRERIEETSLDQTGAIGGHVILCGYGSFGRTLSEMLDRAGINHVVVTNNTEDYVRAREADKSVVFGDPADPLLLNGLRIREAMNTILALDDFEEVQRVSAAINLIDPEIRVIAKVQTEEERLQLEQFNHELLLDGNTHAAGLLVDRLGKSRLLARETSRLQFLGDYRLDEPIEAITKVEQEQARLLEIMTASFNGLREDREIMHLKALHDSFMVLSEIIEDAIRTIMKQAQLPPQQYERINILLDNQHQLTEMNEALERLGRELKDLATHDRTRRLSQTAVEGLDSILMTLIDLAKGYSEEDMVLFRSMTSVDDSGLAGIRAKYLGAKTNLDAEAKTLLFSSTNHMDRLRSLFGLVGENYRRLAAAGL